VAGRQKIMHSPKFIYNKSDVACHFCARTANPHPDFDEPIVITKLKLKTHDTEICINCWHELDTLAKRSNRRFDDVVNEKEGIIRLLNKSIFSDKLDF
jgi:hypothetical protein